MALSTSTPTQITAGDTAEWLLSLTDYPASSWTLTYYLVKDGAQVSFSASQYESGDTHHIDNAATTTAEWGAGTYSYRATVSDGADRHTVEEGTIEVLPNFATATTGLDDRSFAKKALDAIEAVLLGRASQAQLEYSIAGRTLKFIPHTELLDMRKRFREEYIAEERRKRRRKTGSAAVGRVEIRFTGR